MSTRRKLSSAKRTARPGRVTAKKIRSVLSVPPEIWPVGDRYALAYSALCDSISELVPMLKQLELSDLQIATLMPTLEEISEALDVFSTGFEAFTALLESLELGTP